MFPWRQELTMLQENPWHSPWGERLFYPDFKQLQLLLFFFFFYIDELYWSWCIGTSCPLDVSVWRQGAGKRGTGEQAGAVFAEASGRGSRRCIGREGGWVQWTTSAVAQGKGGSRSWDHDIPLVGWTGNGCNFNSWKASLLKSNTLTLAIRHKKDERARHSGPSQLIKGFG